MTNLKIFLDHYCLHFQDYRFVQPPNGISTTMLASDERKPLTSGQHGPVAQRVSNKSGGARRNRRKADLAQEASPQRDDEDECYLSTSTGQQGLYFSSFLSCFSYVETALCVAFFLIVPQVTLFGVLEAEEERCR